MLRLKIEDKRYNTIKFYFETIRSLTDFMEIALAHSKDITFLIEEVEDENDEN